MKSKKESKYFKPMKWTKEQRKMLKRLHVTTGTNKSRNHSSVRSDQNR